METDELTTTLVIAFHQDGIQAAIGPCVRVCHNQCILSPERSVSNYGKDKVTPGSSSTAWTAGSPISRYR